MYLLEKLYGVKKRISKISVYRENEVAYKLYTKEGFQSTMLRMNKNLE